jgi:hypothetical protein
MRLRRLCCGGGVCGQLIVFGITLPRSTWHSVAEILSVGIVQFLEKSNHLATILRMLSSRGSHYPTLPSG